MKAIVFYVVNGKSVFLYDTEKNEKTFVSSHATEQEALDEGTRLNDELFGTNYADWK